MLITKQYLLENKNHIFVFGDNKIRKGKKGAATLRDMSNTYGFITKKLPNNASSSFYTVKEYIPVFEKELKLLEKEIQNNSEKIYLISKLGAGLANKHKIFENIIKDGLLVLQKYPNVKFLFKI